MKMMNLSDLTVLGSAFVFGAFSSLHCSVMCGPLVHLSMQSQKSKLQGNLLYQTGRLSSYLFLGFLLSFAGKGANALPLFQKWGNLAPILGLVFFLWIGISTLFPNRISLVFRTKKEGPTLSQRFVSWLYRWKTPALVSLGIGFLSGFFPCGVLYPAYALAFSVADPWFGSLVLFSFFLGTFPLLFGMSWGAIRILQGWKPNLLPWVGVVVMLASLWMGSHRWLDKNAENCERHQVSLP